MSAERMTQILAHSRMDTSVIGQMKAMEDENQRLKRM